MDMNNLSGSPEDFKEGTGDVDALVEIVSAIGRYAFAQLSTLQEIDVNPVIVRPAGKGAVAVDALIRLKQFSQ